MSEEIRNEDTAEEAVEETVSEEAVSEEVTEEAPAESEADKLTKQLADAEEKYKRLDAEYYNYRNRSLKEKQDAADNATAKAVTEILSVTDNFERAVNAECSDESYKKGTEMIFRQFTDILTKLGVEEIEALGQPFDPNVHNAVTQTADENFGENTVCQVFQKGYKLNGKVIRCAMVCVANP